MKITNSVGFALSLVLLFLFVDTPTAQPQPTALLELMPLKPFAVQGIC
ncbi:hypothetical protein WKK05_27915 [Nostoc sp. UHCC 0302]